MLDLLASTLPPDLRIWEEEGGRSGNENGDTPVLASAFGCLPVVRSPQCGDLSRAPPSHFPPILPKRHLLRNLRQVRSVAADHLRCRTGQLQVPVRAHSLVVHKVLTCRAFVRDLVGCRSLVEHPDEHRADAQLPNDGELPPAEFPRDRRPLCPDAIATWVTVNATISSCDEQQNGDEQFRAMLIFQPFSDWCETNLVWRGRMKRCGGRSEYPPPALGSGRASLCRS